MEQYNGFEIIPATGNAIYRTNLNNGNVYCDGHTAGKGFAIVQIESTRKAGLIFNSNHPSIKSAKAEIDFVTKFPFFAYHV